MDEAPVEKREGRITRTLREVAERAGSLANRIKGMTEAPGMKELRELKSIGTLISALAEKYPRPAAKTETPDVEKLVAAAVEKAIGQAVSEAVKPLQGEIARLREENVKLAKALAEPAERASSAEPPASSPGANADILFPLDYNDELYRDELKKRGINF
jgi:hypothetical protein